MVEVSHSSLLEFLMLLILAKKLQKLFIQVRFEIFLKFLLGVLCDDHLCKVLFYK